MRDTRDKILEALSRIGVGMSRTGDRLYGETKYVIDLSKLRLEVKDAQYEIRMEMEAMGRIYYESEGQASPEAYEPHETKIHSLERKIAEVEAEMARMEQRRAASMPAAPAAQTSMFDSEEASVFVTLPPEELVSIPEEMHPCPHCGAMMSRKLAYCTQCHEKLN